MDTDSETDSTKDARVSVKASKACEVLDSRVAPEGGTAASGGSAGRVQALSETASLGLRGVMNGINGKMVTLKGVVEAGGEAWRALSLGADRAALK